MTWYDKINNMYKHGELYMKIANEFAGESNSPRLKVGCIIVTEEGIIYPGYNGDELGGDNVPDSLEPGESGFVHAEVNAISKFNSTIHKNSVMYVTHSPCVVCARTIINTMAIKQVCYGTLYRDSKGIDLLNKRGISCTYFNDIPFSKKDE